MITYFLNSTISLFESIREEEILCLERLNVCWDVIRNNIVRVFHDCQFRAGSGLPELALTPNPNLPTQHAKRLDY